MNHFPLNEDDRQLVLGALDTLGAALAGHGHVWSEGERGIYEEAIKIMGGRQPDFTRAEDEPGEEWKKGE